MKCRFCGKRIKKNSNVCSKCGREVTEGLGTDELIDALPELHDEFDNISKIQEKEKEKKEKKEKRAKGKTTRIVVAILIILAILAGVTAGTLYFKQKELERQAAEEAKIPTTSAIDSLVEKSFMKGGFTDTLVTDELSALQVIKEQKEMFSFVDADREFVLKRKIKAGTKQYIVSPRNITASPFMAAKW